jgi:hypothetical protein
MTPKLCLRAVAAAVCAAFFCSAQTPSAPNRGRKEPAVYNGPVRESAPKPQPLSRSFALRGVAGALAEPGHVRLAEIPVAELQRLGSRGGKRYIGLHRDVPLQSMAQGTWTALPDGSRVWRLRISSPSAAGMRVHFTEFSTGEAGAEPGKVWLYSADGSGEADGPYSGGGPFDNGDFWSSIVAGESLVIEFAPAIGTQGDAVPFRIRQVAHHTVNLDAEIEAAAKAAEAARLREPKPVVASTVLPASTILLPTEITPDVTPKPLPDYAASCNQDVNCFPAWQDTKRAVAHILFEETQGDAPGTYECSGSLVGTRDDSFRPYLLTAGHCIHDEASARTLQTWWAYESPGCLQGPPLSKGTLKSSAGGHLLAWATIQKGDYSLVVLPDVPSGVVFAGWDPSDVAVGSPVVGVHHPMGSYKRISFGTVVASFDANVEGADAPPSRYTDVNWTSGITEPGSSGSALFSGPAVVVGMLTYGPDQPGEVACKQGDLGGYGKFSNAYPALSAYLEDLPYSQVTPSVSSVGFSGLNKRVTGKTTQTVTLSTLSAAAVPFFARADAPWIVVTPATGTLSASAPAQIQVTLDPKYLVTADTYTSTITVLSNAAPPQFVNVTMNMVFDVSNVTPSATPNPVANSGGTWTLHLHLADTGGAQSQLNGLHIDGDDYTGNIAGWFGSNSIPANGAIDATIYTQGLNAPTQKFFEFFGQDISTGNTWYRTLTVSFLP